MVNQYVKFIKIQRDADGLRHQSYSFEYAVLDKTHRRRWMEMYKQIMHSFTNVWSLELDILYLVQ